MKEYLTSLAHKGDFLDKEITEAWDQIKIFRWISCDRDRFEGVPSADGTPSARQGLPGNTLWI